MIADTEPMWVTEDQFEAMLQVCENPPTIHSGEFLEAVLEAGGIFFQKPIRLLLNCPVCHTAHVDEGEWATTRLHKTHQCQFCGHEWRPAEVYTVGVAELE